MGKADLQENEPRSDQPTFDDQQDVLDRVQEELRVSHVLESADAQLGTAVGALQGAARAHAALGSSQSLLELLRAAFNVVQSNAGSPAVR